MKRKRKYELLNNKFLMRALKQIKINIFNDDRGSLGVFELKDFVDWQVKRVYYVCDVKKDRGGHAVKGEKKIYICLSGSILAHFHDGDKWVQFKMMGPSDAIILEDMYYRKFTDFSDGAILLALSSVNYNPDDYIYDLDEYIKEIKRKS